MMPSPGSGDRSKAGFSEKLGFQRPDRTRCFPPGALLRAYQAVQPPSTVTTAPVM
jgi:hypothetical protein